MKYTKWLAALLCLCIVFSGCGASLGEIGTEQKQFSIPAYGLQITANDRFEDVTTGNAWDLQITDRSCYISVMAYKYMDLSEGQTTKDAYDFKNTDLFSRRENVEVILEEKTEQVDGKTIVKTRYSAENNEIKNYYDSYLVDFPDAGVFAWVLVTAVPSYVEENTDALQQIVYTLQVQ